jgi:chemotaxis protein CheZ
MTGKSPDFLPTAGMVAPRAPVDRASGASESSGSESSVGDVVADIRQYFIPQAIDQLAAIVEATERAANQIINACDALDSFAPQAGERMARRFEECVTSILLACAFQDLTGQRIANATKTLRRIDRELCNLTSAPGSSTDDGAAVDGGSAAWAAPAGEPEELLGPQRPGDAIDQQAADRLFSQLP